MKHSPIHPIMPAWHRMVSILFKPFDLTKWLLLGFCVFLAQCGQGGSGSGSPPIVPGGGKLSAADRLWFEQNLVIILVFVAVTILAIIILALLAMWVSSRGKFMFIDGIAKNRAAVKEPWKEYKREGNSLFFFRVSLAIISLILFAFAIGIPFAIAIPDFQSERLGTAGIVAIVVGVVLLLLFITVATAVKFMLDVFVVPTMYCRRLRALAAFRLAWRELLRGHLASSIVLFLMLFVFGLAAAMIAFMSICMTACLVIIPYVGTVILLPIPVFLAAYVMEYIQQFGTEWRFFDDDICHKCGYQRTVTASNVCPECGVNTVPTQ